MKKIYLSIITAIASLSLNAQTLTNANHSPVAGEMFSTYQCDSTAINPGAAGAGAMWNFAAIATHSGVINNYTVATNALSSYPMPGVSVASSSTNNISYYNSSATDLKYWGGNISLGSIGATLVYSASAISAAYPMSLNTTSSAVTGGSITIPALTQSGTFTGNSNTLADGTGTLMLASGTYTNVVRVVTTQTISYTIQFGAGSVIQKNYDYYASGIKNALFSISTSTISSFAGTSTQTFVTRERSLTTGLNQNVSNKISLAVYPNPSTSQVNFVTENVEAKQVIISDVTGKLVEKQNLNEGKLKLDVSGYTSGLYLYSIIGSANQAIMSGKITVSH